MQQFKLYKKIQLPILNLLLISGVSFADSIGDIIEQTGSTQLIRNKEEKSVTETYLPGIELYDTAETSNGRMLIEFKDKAELALTEHTSVLIDEIIYDPNPNLSKMSLKMVQGTARFASGSLGLVNKANIDIQTPTATIGIRGTDFTTTIDEIGRSLIMLLPDDKGDPSGEIIITNAGGSITLNEAYQATLVQSFDKIPEQSYVVDNINNSMIDNMFIVNPPPEVKEQMEDEAADSAYADQGVLDIDFLEYNELEKDIDDYLEEDEDKSSRIDYDALSGDFLPDLLDVVEELLRTTAALSDAQGTDSLAGFSLKGAEFGFNKDSQYNIFQEDGRLIVFRDINGRITISFQPGANFSLTTEVEGYAGTITGNNGEDIIVVIKQTN